MGVRTGRFKTGNVRRAAAMGASASIHEANTLTFDATCNSLHQGAIAGTFADKRSSPTHKPSLIEKFETAAHARKLHPEKSIYSHDRFTTIDVVRSTVVIWNAVRFTYNEANIVIMTVTGSASHMRGSEFCQRKQLCPGYRPMGLSRNSAY